MVAHPNRSRRTPGPAATPQPEAIRAWREAAGLTQTAAAHLVHAGLRSWQQWESGERRMHPAMWELARLKARPRGVT